jgi:hypothetical protein
MSRYALKEPDADPAREWADEGLPIGSPNDPALGEAPNQTTGPGGSGLRALRLDRGKASGNDRYMPED